MHKAGVLLLEVNRGIPVSFHLLLFWSLTLVNGGSNGDALLFSLFGGSLLFVPFILDLHLVLAVEGRVVLEFWLVLKEHAVVNFLLVDSATVELWISWVGLALLHLIGLSKLSSEFLGLLGDTLIPPFVVLLIILASLKEHAVVLLFVVNGLVEMRIVRVLSGISHLLIIVQLFIPVLLGSGDTLLPVWSVVSVGPLDKHTVVLILEVQLVFVVVDIMWVLGGIESVRFLLKILIEVLRGLLDTRLPVWRMMGVLPLEEHTIVLLLEIELISVVVDVVRVLGLIKSFTIFSELLIPVFSGLINSINPVLRVVLVVVQLSGSHDILADWNHVGVKLRQVNWLMGLTNSILPSHLLSPLGLHSSLARFLGSLELSILLGLLLGKHLRLLEIHHVLKFLSLFVDSIIPKLRMLVVVGDIEVAISWDDVFGIILMRNEVLADLEILDSGNLTSLLLGKVKRIGASWDLGKVLEVWLIILKLNILDGWDTLEFGLLLSEIKRISTRWNFSHVGEVTIELNVFDGWNTLEFSLLLGKIKRIGSLWNLRQVLEIMALIELDKLVSSIILLLSVHGIHVSLISLNFLFDLAASLSEVVVPLISINWVLTFRNVVGVISVISVHTAVFATTLQLNIVISWNNIISIILMVLNVDIVISWHNIIGVVGVIGKLNVLLMLVVVTMMFLVVRTSLSVVSSMVLMEESVVVTIWRQLSVVELFMIVSDSLDILWGISYIWIVGRDIVSWVSAVNSIMRIVELPPATFPVLVTVGMMWALIVRTGGWVRFSWLSGISSLLVSSFG